MTRQSYDSQRSVRGRIWGRHSGGEAVVGNNVFPMLWEIGWERTGRQTGRQAGTSTVVSRRRNSTHTHTPSFRARVYYDTEKWEKRAVSSRFEARESWRNRRERVSVGLGVDASTGDGCYRLESKGRAATEGRRRNERRCVKKGVGRCYHGLCVGASGCRVSLTTVGVCGRRAEGGMEGPGSSSATRGHRRSERETKLCYDDDMDAGGGAVCPL